MEPYETIKYRGHNINIYYDDDANDPRTEFDNSGTKEYDAYLSGQVFGYQVEPTDQNKKINCDDSCWGYYGTEEIEYITSEAKNAIDYKIGEYKKQVIENKKRQVEMNHFMKTCMAL